MVDKIAESKRAHDQERQSRAVLVRLSEEEAREIDRLRKKETRAAYLRSLLAERAARTR